MYPTPEELIRFTPAELELLPTDTDIAFYQEHGYYHSKKIFTDAEIDAAIAGSERYYRGERDAKIPSDIPGWRPEHGNVLRKNDYASLRNRELTALIRKPLLGAVAARLAGSGIRLWHDQLLYKPPQDDPHKPGNVGWHTDKEYWKTASSRKMLTAWIPFHDCDEEMGTIMMIDQSWSWPDNTEGLDFFSNDLAGLEKKFQTGGRPVVKVPINLRKGEVSFHSCLTIHGSGPNRSTQPRRSIAVHMQDEKNHYQEAFYNDGVRVPDSLDNLCRLIDDLPDYSDPRICPPLWPV